MAGGDNVEKYLTLAFTSGHRVLSNTCVTVGLNIFVAITDNLISPTAGTAINPVNTGVAKKFFRI